MTHTLSGLRWAAALIMGFGLLTALAVVPALGALGILPFADLVTWPMDGAEGLTTPEGRLALAIIGGISFGWGFTLWHLAGVKDPASVTLVRRATFCGVAGWFVADSCASVLAGAPLNLVGNAAFAAAVMWPMARTGQTATV